MWRGKGAGAFLLFANLGLASFSVIAVAYALDLRSNVIGYLVLAATLLFLVSLVGLFLTRHSDEYVEALWNSAASAAFAALVLGMVATQIGMGIVGHDSATREQSDRLHAIPLTLPFLAFFVVLSLRRLRSSR
jgi:ABC-type sulfate transport system permease component